MGERGNGPLVASVGFLVFLGVLAGLGAPITDDGVQSADPDQLIPSDGFINGTLGPVFPDWANIIPVLGAFTQILDAILAFVPDPTPFFAFIFNVFAVYAEILAEGNIFVKAVVIVPFFILIYNVLYFILYLIKDLIPTTKPLLKRMIEV